VQFRDDIYQRDGFGSGMATLQPSVEPVVEPAVQQTQQALPTGTTRPRAGILPPMNED